MELLTEAKSTHTNKMGILRERENMEKVPNRYHKAEEHYNRAEKFTEMRS